MSTQKKVMSIKETGGNITIGLDTRKELKLFVVKEGLKTYDEAIKKLLEKYIKDKHHHTQ